MLKDKLMEMKGIHHAEFECDLKNAFIPIPHFWEHTIGSCHAALALRADWQAQLLHCKTELGFKYVRFHGLLGDEMSVVIRENDRCIYSFFNIDQIFDFLLSIGMRPFVELSFMPSALASGPGTVFHYKANITPPADYDAWAALISALTTHWVSRYGLEEVCNWFFEVWNEPNLPIFWTGSQDAYFKLYKYTAEAIKAVHPDLRTGGPATACNEWVTGFLRFAADNNVPVDFISTHHYPNDAFGKPGDDTITQLAGTERSVLRQQAQAVHRQAAGKPVYYTEWSGSSNPRDELHDTSYAAAFIIKTILEANGLAQGYSYWTFSDIFEETGLCSVPFHGGFGLLNIYGIPKPACRAFELLHGTGHELLPVTGQHSTVDVWTIKMGQTIHIIVTNWALPLHDIKAERITVRLLHTGTVQHACQEKISARHANAHTAWVDMGRPAALTAAQVAALSRASALVKEPVIFGYHAGSIYIEAEMPPQSCTRITLEMN